MQPKSVQMNIIAHIHTDFPTKFAIPRQSGLVEQLKAQIIFEPQYRTPDAFRGLEKYSHIWLLWQFSQADKPLWSATVRPPRLGGNKRIGVFATRSPYRPNPIGLSAVKLERIEYTEKNGPVLHVCGADLMDGTPIFDIKPYLSYTDSKQNATCGFADEVKDNRIKVDFPQDMMEQVPFDHRAALTELLSQDPRPSYQNDPNRAYGFIYAGMEIKFSVDGGLLTVKEVTLLNK